MRVGDAVDSGMTSVIVKRKRVSAPAPPAVTANPTSAKVRKSVVAPTRTCSRDCDCARLRDDAPVRTHRGRHDLTRAGRARRSGRTRGSRRTSCTGSTRRSGRARWTGRTRGSSRAFCTGCTCRSSRARWAGRAGRTWAPLRVRQRGRDISKRLDHCALLQDLD